MSLIRQSCKKKKHKKLHEENTYLSTFICTCRTFYLDIVRTWTRLQEREEVPGISLQGVKMDVNCAYVVSEFQKWIFSLQQIRVNPEYRDNLDTDYIYLDTLYTWFTLSFFAYREKNIIVKNHGGELDLKMETKPIPFYFFINQRKKILSKKLVSSFLICKINRWTSHITYLSNIFLNISFKKNA